MFDSLRKTLSGFSKTFAEKDLEEADIEEVLSDLEISLLQSDVALEVVEEISADLKERLTGISVNKKEVGEFVKTALIQSISSMFEGTGTIDVFERIREQNARGDPYLIVFLGINGTGKTTTLAKFAHLLKQQNLTVAVAAADTFRAGAIEQIREHTERLQVKLVAQNYNSDPAAVARDAVLYAKSHRVNCVLVDTAGRIQTSTNLMQQIEKITKVVNPDLKIFIGDSLAGNDAVSQAREFHEYTDFDCSILTKSDADAKGGAALSIVKMTSKPILYLGVGQEYPDLKPFRKEAFLETVFGDSSKIDREMLSRMPEVQSSPANDVAEQAASSEDDPFDGISDDDIAEYSEIYDVPPPDNDAEARDLASNIRRWISKGRPTAATQQEESTRDRHVSQPAPATKPAPDEAPAPEPEPEPEPEPPAPEEMPQPAPAPEPAPEPEPEPPAPAPEEMPQPAPAPEPAPEPEPEPPAPAPEEMPQPAPAPEPEPEPEPEPPAPAPEEMPQPAPAPEPEPEPEPEPPAPAPEEMPQPAPAPEQTLQPTEPAQKEYAPSVRDDDITDGEPEDPFQGIEDNDIAMYSEIYDVPPPETDADAQEIAAKIRQWIKQGRPDPIKSSTSTEHAVQPERESELEPEPEPEPEPKPKKKRGFFGMFRK